MLIALRPSWLPKPRRGAIVGTAGSPSIAFRWGLMTPACWDAINLAPLWGWAAQCDR
jgi:hypothetical protein